jgi:hypothetical protein
MISRPTKMLFGYEATVTLNVNGRRVEVDALEIADDGPVIVNTKRIIAAVSMTKAEAVVARLAAARAQTPFNASEAA